MSQVSDPPPAASAATAVAGPRPLQRLRLFGVDHPWIVVVVPFAALYLVAALLLALPMYEPDEMLYQHLAWSVAHGEGFRWRGDPVALRSGLYVYLIAPSWLLASGVRAYEIAKAETALLSCLVAVPVWILARDMLSRRLALLTVALSLAGTWMLAGLLVTESVALPLATSSLAATVWSLRRRSAALTFLALILALLSAWARLQLLVLVPVITAALVLDVLRSGRSGRTETLRAYRAPLAVLAAICGLGITALLLKGERLLGGYGDVVNYRPSLGAIVSGSGEQLLQLAALSGLIPLLLLCALLVRPRAWRDDIVGPLLAVLVPAVVALALQNGFFIRGNGVPFAIQRYMIYAAPLLLLFTIAAFSRDRLVGWRTASGMALLSVVLWLTPEVGERVEQRAVFSTAERVDQIVPGLSTGAAMTVVGGLLSAVVLVLTANGPRRGRGRVAFPIGAALLVLLVAQTLTATVWQIDFERSNRHAAFPADLEWLDRHSRGPVAVLNVSDGSAAFSRVEFFNDHISRYYSQQIPVPGHRVAGGVCGWTIGPEDGSVNFADGCPASTSEFFLNDPVVRLTFHDEVRSASDVHLGRLVAVRGAPKLLAAIQMPCVRGAVVVEPVTLRAYPDAPVRCNTALKATLWPRASGTLAVGIRGAAAEPHTVQVGLKSYPVPPGTVTVIALRVTAAAVVVKELDLDWDQTSPQDPAIVSLDFVSGNGRRQSLL